MVYFTTRVVYSIRLQQCTTVNYRQRRSETIAPNFTICRVLGILPFRRYRTLKERQKMDSAGIRPPSTVHKYLWCCLSIEPLSDDTRTVATHAKKHTHKKKHFKNTINLAKRASNLARTCVCVLKFLPPSPLVGKCSVPIRRVYMRQS